MACDAASVHRALQSIEAINAQPLEKVKLRDRDPWNHNVWRHKEVSGDKSPQVWRPSNASVQRPLPWRSTSPTVTSEMPHH